MKLATIINPSKSIKITIIIDFDGLIIVANFMFYKDF